jgi:hypothetical protein
MISVARAGWLQVDAQPDDVFRIRQTFGSYRSLRDELLFSTWFQAVPARLRSFSPSGTKPDTRIRDGTSPCTFSRHFMPGYHRGVPSGQRADIVHKTCATSASISCYKRRREQARSAVISPLSRIARRFLAHQKRKSWLDQRGNGFWGPIEPANEGYKKLIPIQQFF